MTTELLAAPSGALPGLNLARAGTALLSAASCLPMQIAVNGVRMPDELLSLLFLIAVIAILVVVSFLVWVHLSLINCQRRIADSLEELVRRLDPTVEKRDSEREWVI